MGELETMIRLDFGMEEDEGCNWTSDEGRDVGLTTSEEEGRCRIGFCLPLCHGKQGRRAGASCRTYRASL